MAPKVTLELNKQEVRMLLFQYAVKADIAKDDDCEMYAIYKAKVDFLKTKHDQLSEDETYDISE